MARGTIEARNPDGRIARKKRKARVESYFPERSVMRKSASGADIETDIPAPSAPGPLEMFYRTGMIGSSPAEVERRMVAARALAAIYLEARLFRDLPEPHGSVKSFSSHGGPLKGISRLEYVPMYEHLGENMRAPFFNAATRLIIMGGFISPAYLGVVLDHLAESLEQAVLMVRAKRRQGITE